jgi:uncharacterized membrane protein YfcA
VIAAHDGAFLAYVAGVGLFASLFAGIVGVGAVLLIAPLLFFGGPWFFGVAIDFKEISNLTTFAVVIAAMRAIFIYRSFGLVRREVIGPMGIPAFVFAALGVVLASFARPQAIQAVFAIASLAGAAFLLVPYRRELDDATRELHHNPIPYAIAASIVGFVGGFAGAGGGFLLIPTLMGIFRLPTRIALGTASFTGLVIALVAFAGRIALLHVDWVLVAAIGIGSLAGTEIGTRYQQRVPTAILRRAVVCVVGISAFRLLFQLG